MVKKLQRAKHKKNVLTKRLEEPSDFVLRTVNITVFFY